MDTMDLPRSNKQHSLHGPQPPRAPSRRATADRDRLLRRVQADVAQARADIQRVQEQTQRLLAIEATRPLTPAEAEQARTLPRDAQALRLRLQQLRAEFVQLQHQRRAR